MKFFAILPATLFAASPVLASPYVNVENNAGFSGSNFIGHVTDFHLGYEGGTIVPYDRCLRGGYGLIQWTSIERYIGLGSHCTELKQDPSGLKCQTDYLIKEMKFRKDLFAFQTNHQTIPYYMNAAYYWLGWGVHGNRTQHTYSFLTKLQ